jgi:dimethylglycine dehydrogenase
MKSHARVVVIGGGVVGVSTLYHLARKGWSDVILVERKELTSGSTWHAAGLLPLFNMSYSVGQIHKYSVRFYQELEAETGQHVGFAKCSNIRLARTPERMDEYHYYAGVARTIGVEVRWLTPDELKQVWPLCSTDGIIGAIQHPEDGYIQPADLTQALAKGARSRGAEIYRNTAVTAIEQKANGEWVVKTDKGDITCEHVVTASGNFARHVGAMVGLDVPVIPVEHQYIVTEPHPAIVERRKAQGLPEMGVLRESDSSWYMREEAGLLLGPYEMGAPCCYVDGPGAESEYELFQEDIERLMPHIETAIERVPAFGEVGVKKVYNGAIAYTPDGSPIIGPAWGLKNFWLNEGHSFGVTAAGGAGWQLAEWIVEGEPTIDMMGVDPRRFGPYATRGYLRTKNEEAYANVFTPHYPDEERVAGRPLKRAPCYERMAALGAVFGSVYGWERPNWFAPEDYEVPGTSSIPTTSCSATTTPADHTGRIRERWSFRRSNYFEHVGNECRPRSREGGASRHVGLRQVHVTGPGAEAWLDSVMANRIPKTIGRINLCHLLAKNGGVRSEFTVYRTGPQSFYLVSAGAFERHDHDTLEKLLPADGSVRMSPCTTQYGVLVLAGPARAQRSAEADRRRTLERAFPLAQRTADQCRPRHRRCAAGQLRRRTRLGAAPPDRDADHDLRSPDGGRRGIRAQAVRHPRDGFDADREVVPPDPPRAVDRVFAAFESGLDRFVHPNKGNFIGRDALVEWRERGFANRFVTLEVHGVTHSDARGNEAIWKDGQLVGRATSGGYGWRLGKSLALAIVRPDLGETGTDLEIQILGDHYRATVIEESPFDPGNARLRA